MTTNALTPLIVPATIANQDTIRQLLLYCDTVFLYAPDEGFRSDLPAELRDLCRHYAPVPFGDRLHNFEQLIRDITGHRAEYYGGGLSSLSATTSAVDEESVWKLIKRLHPGETAEAPQETLFQARLLLKLAEARDREEQEIARTLATLDAQGQTLLRGLTNGDDEDGDKMKALVDFDRQRSDETMEKRLRAWAHLFLADPRVNEHWLLAGPPDVMAVLVDHATTSMISTPAAKILSLPLPDEPFFALDPSHYLTERTAWRRTAGELIAKACEVIMTAATTGKIVEGVATLEQEMRSCFDRHPTWGRGHRDSLDFLLLPLSLPRLFAKIAKRPEPPAADQALAYGVVAVPHRDLSDRG